MADLRRGPCYPLTAFTVTVSTPIREDGEAPFVFIVTARTPQEATAVALSICGTEQELLDSHGRIAVTVTGEPACVVDSVIVGIPEADCGYLWNDRRVSHHGDAAWS